MLRATQRASASLRLQVRPPKPQHPPPGYVLHTSAAGEHVEPNASARATAFRFAYPPHVKASDDDDDEGAPKAPPARVDAMESCGPSPPPPALLWVLLVCQHSDEILAPPLT